MPKYARRVAKYLLFIFSVIILIIVIQVAMGKSSYNDALLLFTASVRVQLFLLLVVVYALFYPSLVYGRREIFITGTFEENRENFLKGLSESDFYLAREEDKTLIFRKKPLFVRIITFGEDVVEADTSSNPVVLDGRKKDLLIIQRLLGVNLTQKSNE